MAATLQPTMTTSWDVSDPGNQRMDEQRDERARELVADLGHPVRRTLDLGCGRAEAAGSLGLDPAVGVDLGILRLRLAPVPVAQADAARLPFPNGTFDLVLALNVISSIPIEGHRRVVAAEAMRVLGPDGVILWYDQRWPNPGNRSTRPVSHRDLTTLFPGAAVDVEPITVLPGLARAFPRRYDLLHRLGPLRSHLIGVVRPRP
jgi:SAM-dependent methyltransferase